MKFDSWFKPLFFLISFLILVNFRIDTDLGWHIAIGKEFLENAHIIRSDQFSWTMSGFEWGNSYFAFQILVAYLFSFLDYKVIAVLFGIVAASSILIIIRKKIFIWNLLIVGLGSAIAIANSGIRPHLLDFPFFCLLLVLIERKIFDKILFLPFWFIFFAIWANFHVGFVFGLFTLMVAVFINLANTRKRLTRSVLIIAGTVITVSFAGTFITPFHFLLWKSILLDSAGFTGWANISALQPTAIFAPINILLAISGVVFIRLIQTKYKEIGLSWIFTGSFLFLIGFFVVDFVYFWALFFIFLGTRYFNIKFDLAGSAWQKIPYLFPFYAAFLAFILNFFVIYLESGDLKSRLIKDGYPVYASSFINNNGLGENLFNNYDWGGYLIWQEPQLKVFIDGRMAGWKDNRVNILQEYIEIVKGNCEVLAGYDIKVALVENKTYDCFSDWSTVYEDEVAKVLVE